MALATHRAIDAVWRIESARVIARLTRMVRDVALAEELAQDAFLAALERWPQSGVPENPGAWLMATAKHRAIDMLRRSVRLEHKHEQIARDMALTMAMDRTELDATLDQGPGDELLELIFICCHPLLLTQARLALTLRLLGGLDTPEIARAFLVSEATIAQRIVRAKRTLTEARASFEMPQGEELRQRTDSVLEVVYLIFNEGYAATSGESWMRPSLCEEALRLGRILAELVPEDPETHGLAALMEIQASRMPARVGPAGEPILLLDQDRSRWDRLLIARGLRALERASALHQPMGSYRLQASIAATHARAATPEQTDWVAIAALYEALARRSPSPVVELNRAVAIAMAFGPRAGLRLVDRLLEEPSLKHYHLLPSVRGDLLGKLGRDREAAGEFKRAAALTQNERERELLLGRAAQTHSRARA
jgi:RNA polymerase sigma factor (sigma-70 family)